jgi:hypothetical protein
VIEVATPFSPDRSFSSTGRSTKSGGIDRFWL